MTDYFWTPGVWKHESGFDGGIMLEFHGAKVTSDGRLLAYRDLDDALWLFDSFSANFHDNRTGRNIQHAMLTLLRQSIYSRLAGYEDVNDAERLSIDSVMRAITVKRASATAWISPKRFVSPSTAMAGVSLRVSFLSPRMDAPHCHRGTFQSAPRYNPEACLSTAPAPDSIFHSRTCEPSFWLKIEPHPYLKFAFILFTAKLCIFVTS